MLQKVSDNVSATRGQTISYCSKQPKASIIATKIYLPHQGTDNHWMAMSDSTLCW